MLDQLHGTISTRLTNDIDLAIKIDTWHDFDKLKTTLLESGHFRSQDDNGPRFYHIPTGVPIDIIPFGQLDEPDHLISWSPKSEKGMSTLGFQEAYDGSIKICIAINPDIWIRVPNRACLVIMKFIVWNENSARAKDAPDILHLIRNYLDPDNQKRLLDEQADICGSDDFDYENAGARLMGRDIATIASPQVLQVICKVLDNETQEGSDFKLIYEMLGNIMEREYRFDRVLEFLRQLNLGIHDIKK